MRRSGRSNRKTACRSLRLLTQGSTLARGCRGRWAPLPGACPCCWPHRDFKLHFLTELPEDFNHTVDGEAPKLRRANTRKLGRGNACQTFCRTGIQLTLIEHADDLGGENSTGLGKVGIRSAEIAEDIAAAGNELNIVAHWKASFKRSTEINRNS